jgi:hypothetical protein
MIYQAQEEACLPIHGRNVHIYTIHLQVRTLIRLSRFESAVSSWIQSGGLLIINCLL